MSYLIEKNHRTGLYTLSVDGVVVAEGLDLSEAVIMLETLMRGE